jgi:KAP family P-loop domain
VPLRLAGDGEVPDAVLRLTLSQHISEYIEKAIGADEFDSIDYYNLDRGEVAGDARTRLRQVLRTAQLGVIAELYERAMAGRAQEPKLRGAVTPWTVIVFLGALLLLGGSVLAVQVIGNNWLSAVLFALLAIVSGYAIWRAQRAGRQFTQARSKALSPVREYDKAIIQQLVAPVIREIINSRLNHYDNRLTVRKTPGLMTDDPLFWIDTDNSYRLLNLMAVMPDGGSIGLAGPRGCGKSTLLRELCTSELELPAGEPSVAVLVTAPIEFASRDFLLYLFGRICQESLRDASPENSSLQTEHPEAAGYRRHVGFIKRNSGKCFLLGILCVIASLFVAYAALPSARQSVAWHWLRIRLANALGKNKDHVFADTNQAWRFVHSLDTRLSVISVVLFLVGLVLLLLAVGRLVSFMMPFFVSRRKDTQIEQLARHHLRNIRFQQSYSYGWSGTLTLPVAQVGINEAHSLAENQQSLPDIVSGMREFLEHVAKTGPVVIAVDELDKVASDITAAKFLNDLKGIFGVRDCFYLVSVSEEALSNFELRGFPFRDAFDSAFDEVLHLRPLTYTESKRLLQRRVVGLSAPYLCLSQCLAGGLPRDLVRVTRNLAEIGQRRTRMRDVVGTLVRFDLEERAHAAIIALRRISGKFEIEPMVLWINQISGCIAGWSVEIGGDSGTSASEIKARELLELCAKYPAAAHDVMVTTVGAGAAEGAEWTASQLGLGLAGSLYYLATVIELFREDRTKAEFQELDGSAADAPKIKQAEYLARARHSFAVSPTIAWKQISEFRARWDMAVLDSPGLGHAPHEGS